MERYIETRAEISANWNDRKVKNTGRVQVATTPDIKDQVFFNVFLSNDREDDYLTVSFRVDELLSAIGKSIYENTIEED